MHTDRFKFRIWNGEQMVSPDYITRDGYGHWKENSIPTSSNKLMQCAGLKDIEGRLIYEGDLLIMSKHSDGKSCEVTWNAGCYCCFPFGTLEAALPYCKIVGNIYETIQK